MFLMESCVLIGPNVGYRTRTVRYNTDAVQFFCYLVFFVTILKRDYITLSHITDKCNGNNFCTNLTEIQPF